MGNEITLQQPDDSEAKGQATLVEKQANEMVVANQSDYDAAGKFLVQVKGIGKNLWDRLNEPCAKANAAWKAMVKIRDEAMAPFTSAEFVVKQKMGQYQWAIEEKRRKEQAAAEAKARKEAEEKRAREIAEARKMKDKEAVKALEQAPLEVQAAPIKTPEPTKASGISHRKYWKVQSVDASKLPLRYMMPDMKAIEATVRGLGAKHGIPGVTVVEETITTVRS